MAELALKSLMSPHWQVVFVQNIDGIDAMDTLSFTPTNQISSTHQPAASDLNGLTNPIPWGSWSLASEPNRITGKTIKGDSYCIDYIPSTGSGPDYLICSMDSSQTRRGTAVGTGAAAAIVTALAVGGVLHDLWVGLLAGLIAGAAAAVINQILAGTGPKATWVATDGGAGGLQVEDNPREASALKVVKR